MASAGNGASVRAGVPSYGDAMRGNSSVRQQGDRVVANIPAGGHATVRKHANGVMVQVHDKNYNEMGPGFFAPSADRVDLT